MPLAVPITWLPETHLSERLGELVPANQALLEERGLWERLRRDFTSVDGRRESNAGFSVQRAMHHTKDGWIFTYAIPEDPSVPRPSADQIIGLAEIDFGWGGERSYADVGRRKALAAKLTAHRRAPRTLQGPIITAWMAPVPGHDEILNAVYTNLGQQAANVTPETSVHAFEPIGTADQIEPGLRRGGLVRASSGSYEINGRMLMNSVHFATRAR